MRILENGERADFSEVVCRGQTLSILRRDKEMAYSLIKRQAIQPLVTCGFAGAMPIMETSPGGSRCELSV